MKMTPEQRNEIMEQRMVCEKCEKTMVPIVDFHTENVDGWWCPDCCIQIKKEKK